MSDYRPFYQADKYLPCRDREKAERCQLSGQAAMDYERSEAACSTLFQQWYEFSATERKAWRDRMVRAFASAAAVGVRSFKGVIPTIIKTVNSNVSE